MTPLPSFSSFSLYSAVACLSISFSSSSLPPSSIFHPPSAPNVGRKVPPLSSFSLLLVTPLPWTLLVNKVNSLLPKSLLLLLLISIVVVDDTLILSFKCLCNVILGHALYFESLFNNTTRSGDDVVVDTEEDSRVDNVGSELLLDDVTKLGAVDGVIGQTTPSSSTSADDN